MYRRKNLRALDEVVANEGTVEARAEGGLSKSGESSQTTSRGGGAGSVGSGRRGSVLAGSGNRSSRRANVLVLGDSLGNASGEGHGGNDVGERRHLDVGLRGGNN
jgi:hypothetical protein